VVDPLVATLLGVILFGERPDHHPIILTGEVLALGLLIGSVVLLSRSPLVHGETSASDAVLALPAPEKSLIETMKGGDRGRPTGEPWIRAHPLAPQNTGQMAQVFERFDGVPRSSCRRIGGNQDMRNDLARRTQ
jgi:hypothetical protein